MRGCADRQCTQCKHVYSCLFSRTGVGLPQQRKSSTFFPDIHISRLPTASSPDFSISSLPLSLFRLSQRQLTCNLHNGSKMEGLFDSGQHPRVVGKKSRPIFSGLLQNYLPNKDYRSIQIPVTTSHLTTSCVRQRTRWSRRWFRTTTFLPRHTNASVTIP